MKDAKKTAIAAIVCFAVAFPAVRGQAEGLVSRNDYDVPDAWALKKFSGRDFWPGFYADSQSARCAGYGSPCEDWDLDIFRDGMVEYGTYKLEMARIVLDKPNFKKNYAKYNPKFVEKDHYDFRDYFSDKVWKAIEGGIKKPSPAFMVFNYVRPPFFLPKEPRGDREAFRKWRAANPNFVGIRCLSEYDSEANGYELFVKNVPDPKLKKELLESFPLPKNEDEWMANAREARRRTQEMLFGCDDLWSLCSSTFSLSMLMADIGVKGLWYEATGQEFARWQLAGAYLRGAARQFDLPYGWYVAHWYSGYRRNNLEKLTQGSNYWTGDKTPAYVGAPFHPWQGLGRTMLDRQNAYGWLIGNGFCQIEDWVRLYRDIDENGKFRPHQVALDFDRLYRLSKTTDRGVVYSPCAILVPVAEKYGASGLSSAKEKYSLSSFFFTLLPIGSDDIQQRSLRRKGIQGCLFNSPFGEFYDCVAPDSSQGDVRVAEVLGRYKCAFLAGGYRKEKLHTAALEKYVRGGGTLFVSWDRVADGLIPASLSGVAFGTDAKTVPAGETLLSSDGATARIGSGYAWAVPEGTPAAKPFYRDEKGQTAGWVHAVGRGRVVTLAAWRFMPEKYRTIKTDGAAHWNDLTDIFAGRCTFELVRALLRRVQDETMPVSVEGDVQWGLNRTKKGWLLWLINNKGVTHFTNDPEEYDASGTAHVKATFKPTGKAYSVDVGPGEWKLVELGE